MAMTRCTININLGLAIKEMVEAMRLKPGLGDIGFQCVECGQPVKAFSDGLQGPHFEHLKRNSRCSLSSE